MGPMADSERCLRKISSFGEMLPRLPWKLFLRNADHACSLGDGRDCIFYINKTKNLLRL